MKDNVRCCWFLRPAFFLFTVLASLHSTGQQTTFEAFEKDTVESGPSLTVLYKPSEIFPANNVLGLFPSESTGKTFPTNPIGSYQRHYTTFISGIVPIEIRTSGPTIDKEQARQAFLYINAVRTSPRKFIKEYPFLADYHPMPSLKWNDTLAIVAERKAVNMATHNYLGHVDPAGFGINHYISKEGYRLDSSWIRKPKANFFESCNGGGLSGKEAISMLLVDNGVPSLGHRKHLLGIDAWSASLYDIGIGYVRAPEGTQYRTYTCVIIAKHGRTQY